MPHQQWDLGGNRPVLQARPEQHDGVQDAKADEEASDDSEEDAQTIAV